jgi:hypothetical protein
LFCARAIAARRLIEPSAGAEGCVKSDLWTAEFTARSDGEVFVYVNDSLKKM